MPGVVGLLLDCIEDTEENLDVVDEKLVVVVEPLIIISNAWISSSTSFKIRVMRAIVSLKN